MQKRSFLGSALLIGGSLILSLLLCEVGSRLYLFGWSAFSIRKLDSVRPLGATGHLRVSPDCVAVWDFEPNREFLFKMASVRTNSRGLRDREHQIPKPPQTVRVAVIGDSYTMPAGVELEDAYHSLLEGWFDEASDGAVHEFVNFAVGGYGLGQYWAVLQHKVPEYDPDLILIGFCAENDHRTPGEDNLRGRGENDRGWEPRSSPAPKAERSQTERESRGGGAAPPFFQSYLVQLLEAAYAAHSPAGKRKEKETRYFGSLGPHQERYVGEMFAKMARFGKELDIPVLIVFLGNRPKDAGPIERLARQHDLGFLDTTSLFAARQIYRYRLSAIDGHPNAAANRLWAQEIYRYLREDLRFPVE